MELMVRLWTLVIVENESQNKYNARGENGGYTENSFLINSPYPMTPLVAWKLLGFHANKSREAYYESTDNRKERKKRGADAEQ